MHELIAFFMSMLPIIELRGGIVYAAVQGIPFAKAFAICYLGNILPIPFILLLLRHVFRWMEQFKYTEKIVRKLEAKAHAKSDQVRKYQTLGLFLFVAIPLPGTGGWTGALIASVMDLDVKKSFVTIALGILCAGIIMSILSYLIPGLFFDSVA